MAYHLCPGCKWWCEFEAWCNEKEGKEVGPNSEDEDRDQEIHDWLLEHEPDYHGETLDLSDLDSEA